MAKRILPLLILSALVLHLVQFSSAAGKRECQTEKAELKKARVSCADYQKNVLLTLRKIFENEENCSPCPKLDEQELRDKLEETEAKLAGAETERLRAEKKLREALAKLAETQAKLVQVESNWLQAQTQLAQAEANPAEMRLNYKGTAAEPEPAIYATTNGGSIHKFSLKTTLVTTMWNSSEDLIGVTFDMGTNTLYWTAWSTIYHAPTNQSEPEAYSTGEYGGLMGLAYDWIAENLYVVTDNGYIVVCNDGARTTKAFRCRTLLSGQRDLRGITVDPNEGTMYYSRVTWRHDVHCILKAGTDGSNPTGIVTGSNGAHGLQIDFESRRLYWTENLDDRIRSSSLDGVDVVTVAPASNPYGIALVGTRIYWADRSSGELNSVSKSGTEKRREAAGLPYPRNLVAANWNPSRNRTNHCEQQTCPGVCVLSRTSFRCLS